MPLGERRGLVLGRINRTGGSPEQDRPGRPAPSFAAKVQSWQSRLGVPQPQAALIASLQEWPSPHPAIVEVMERLERASGPEGLDDWGRGLLCYLTRDGDRVRPDSCVSDGSRR